ncbi:MAG: hypothetical protein IMW92_01520 [Bacillales bacterium]|nr:hypothetical protein [Bacillales bacterium]
MIIINQKLEDFSQMDLGTLSNEASTILPLMGKYSTVYEKQRSNLNLNWRLDFKSFKRLNSCIKAMSNLPLLDLRRHKGTDFLPEDCVYFINPDHDPNTPEWQGENAIVLDERLYYGHGIGITTRQRIIDLLNTKRKKNPNQSAFLINQITRLNFRSLLPYKPKINRDHRHVHQHSILFSNLIISKIGSKTYLL